ncbi:MAG: glycosyltransferase family 2 protein [Candidatus Omnitrophica bacterium]|nr:glycosyltransferase family 2 protein [Candidatus Omnitrophota bacterium]
MDIKRSLVIPVYNGEKTITMLVDKLIEILGKQGVEIILVNDGSRDNSHGACLALAGKYKGSVMYLELSKNFGEHNAVMAGLNHVTGDNVVIMDDDFQNPPEEVPILFDKALAGSLDVVYVQYDEKKHSWARNLGSRFNHFVANLVMDKPKDLYLSSFKCVSRFVAGEIIKYRGPFPYIDGLILRCTNNIGRVKVRHEDRYSGGSGYTLRKLFLLWLNMFVNFSINPLRISTFLGIFLSVLGVVFSGVVITEKIKNPGLVVGYPSLIIAIMVFSGIQLLTLGLLGEYIGRLFLYNNQTPQYVVRGLHGERDGNTGIR